MSVHKEYREKCYFCGDFLGERISFCNTTGIAFIYMPEKEKAHMECYIRKCVEEQAGKK